MVSVCVQVVCLRVTVVHIFFLSFLLSFFSLRKGSGRMDRGGGREDRYGGWRKKGFEMWEERKKEEGGV